MFPVERNPSFCAKVASRLDPSSARGALRAFPIALAALHQPKPRLFPVLLPLLPRLLSHPPTGQAGAVAQRVCDTPAGDPGAGVLCMGCKGRAVHWPQACRGFQCAGVWRDWLLRDNPLYQDLNLPHTCTGALRGSLGSLWGGGGQQQLAWQHAAAVRLS